MANTLFKHDNGKSNHKIMRKVVSILRKCMGLKAIPKAETDRAMLVSCNSELGVERIAIGMKEDRYGDLCINAEGIKKLGLPKGKYEAEQL